MDDGDSLISDYDGNFDCESIDQLLACLNECGDTDASDDFDQTANQTSSNSSTVCSSSSVTDYQLTVKMPRLFKNDIRRSYAEMLVNVSNSSDINSIESFFSVFARPDMAFIQGCDACDYANKTNPLKFQIDSKAVFLQYWFNRLHLAPDQITHFKDVTVVTRHESEESRVECKFTLSLTRVYDLPLGIMKPSIEKVQRLNSRHSEKENKETSSKKRKLSNKKFLERQADMLASIGTDSDKMTYDTSLLERIDHAAIFDSSDQRRFEATGNIVMHLDANKHIELLVFDTLQIEPPPGVTDELLLRMARFGYRCVN